MNRRERVLDFLDGKPVDQPPCMPITMQFACDLIGARYLDYATNYEVLAAGQIETARQFGLDYVNTMSDPALEATDLGATAIFHENGPPAMDDTCSLLADKRLLRRLRTPDPTQGRMGNRLRAVDLLKRQVGSELAVEGWIEGPCAEAADLRGLNTLMLDFGDDPEFVHSLFEFILEVELKFAQAQLEAGADLIGIGDAAASLVGPRIYQEFVFPYELRMMEALKKLGARTHLHICGNTRKILAGMGKLGCSLIDLDYLSPVREGRAEMGPAQGLLGNIDPVRIVRNGEPDTIYQALEVCYEEAGPRYVVGAGCEIPRDTTHQNFQTFSRFANDHKFLA